MKRNVSNRLLGLVLTLCMVLTSMPLAGVAAFAAENEALKFTCVADGDELTNIVRIENGYSVSDDYGTYKSDLYTITVPKGTDKVTFNLSKNGLVYEYDEKGEFVAPWYDDSVAGVKSQSFELKFNESNQSNFYRIQNVYNSDWTGGELVHTVRFVQDTKTNIKNSLNKTSQTIRNFVKNEYGYEWQMMDLAREGKSVDATYYNALAMEIASKNGSLEKDQYSYTNNAKAVLALTAGGYNAEKVAGYNMIDKLTDLDKVTAQGPNGAMYALLALDSASYKTDAAVRDTLVKNVLDSRLDNGMWNYGFDKNADPDLTSIAIMALAPYKDRTEVKAAVDKAIDWLAETMNDDGTYSNYGKSNANSTAVVIWALCANGIDPEADARFDRNGNNPLTGLLKFEVSTGGFGYTDNSAINDFANQQSYEALIAVKRLRNGQSNVYKMHNSAEGLKVISDKAFAPQKTSIKSLKFGKKAFTAAIKKVSGADRYEIRYSKKANMKSAKVIKVTSKNLSKKVSKLGSKKTYYVQARACKTVGAKTYCSAWSASKKVKTK